MIVVGKDIVRAQNPGIGSVTLEEKCEKYWDKMSSKEREKWEKRIMKVR